MASQIRPSRPASSTLFTTSSTLPLASDRTTSAMRESSSVIAGDGVEQQDHGVGGSDGLLALAADLRVEVGAARHPAAGVDEAEGHAEPVGVHLLAVAGDAGLLLDDGDALADDAVHQGGLADVGPTDDGDEGKGHRAPLSAAAGTPRAVRRAWPSVASTSTGRGRSSGARAVEEAAVREAHVGQQVAVPLGLAGEHAGEVLAHEEAGDRGGAAEELVVHRDDPHVGTVELLDERREDPRAVGAREDADGRLAGRAHLEQLVRRGPRAPVGLVVSVDRSRTASAQAKNPASRAGGVGLARRAAPARRCGPCRCRPRASAKPS